MPNYQVIKSFFNDVIAKIILNFSSNDFETFHMVLKDFLFQIVKKINASVEEYENTAVQKQSIFEIKNSYKEIVETKLKSFVHSKKYIEIFD